jgi:SAM-dependent methyltransferase
VGGGGGSIVQWLCRRVGESGSVVATDLDTRFLDALEEPNLRALRHDVRTDALPEAYFDLIHGRLVLEHLPERDDVLRRLVSALRPGGWIVIEDLDTHDLFADPPRIYRYAGDGTHPSLPVWQAIVRVMQRAGHDGDFGYRLLGELLSLGLDEVGGEVRAPIFCGGSPSVAAHRFTLEHMRGSLLELGVPEGELAREVAALDDPRGLFSLPSVLMAAWARRPETARAEAAGAIPERRETMVDRLGHVPLLVGAAVDRHEWRPEGCPLPNRHRPGK